MLNLPQNLSLSTGNLNNVRPGALSHPLYKQNFRDFDIFKK